MKYHPDLMTVDELRQLRYDMLSQLAPRAETGDRMAQVALSLLDSLAGPADVRAALGGAPVVARCPRCDGRGFYYVQEDLNDRASAFVDDEQIVCTLCNGWGEVEE